MPPELLSSELITELTDSRPLYPSGTMELLYDLLSEGIEPEVLQCRYFCTDGESHSLLEIIDKGHLVDVGKLADRLAIFKQFCDLEVIRGTQLAMIEIVANVRGEEPREVRPRVELHEATEPNTPVTGVLRKPTPGLGIAEANAPPTPTVSQEEIQWGPKDLNVEDVQGLVFIAEHPPYKTALLGESWNAIRERPVRITSVGSPLLDPNIQFLREDMLRQYTLRDNKIAPRTNVRAGELRRTGKPETTYLGVPD